jgi:hypothetical protein
MQSTILLSFSGDATYNNREYVLSEEEQCRLIAYQESSNCWSRRAGAIVADGGAATAGQQLLNIGGAYRQSATAARLGVQEPSGKTELQSWRRNNSALYLGSRQQQLDAACTSHRGRRRCSHDGAASA